MSPTEHDPINVRVVQGVQTWGLSYQGSLLSAQFPTHSCTGYASVCCLDTRIPHYSFPDCKVDPRHPCPVTLASCSPFPALSPTTAFHHRVPLSALPFPISPHYLLPMLAPGWTEHFAHGWLTAHTGRIPSASFVLCFLTWHLSEWWCADMGHSLNDSVRVLQPPGTFLGYL